MKRILMLRLLALILFAFSSLTAQETQAVVPSKKFSTKEILLKIVLPSAISIVVLTGIFIFSNKLKKTDQNNQNPDDTSHAHLLKGDKLRPLTRTPSNDDTDSEIQEKIVPFKALNVPQSTSHENQVPKSIRTESTSPTFGKESLGDALHSIRKRRSSNGPSTMPPAPIIEEIQQPISPPQSNSPTEYLAQTVSRDFIIAHSPPNTPASTQASPRPRPKNHISRAPKIEQPLEQDLQAPEADALLSPNSVRKVRSVESLAEIEHDSLPSPRLTSSQPTLSGAAKFRKNRRTQFAKAVAEKLENLPIPAFTDQQEFSLLDKISPESMRQEPESADDDRDSTCSSSINSPKMGSPSNTSLFNTI